MEDDRKPADVMSAYVGVSVAAVAVLVSVFLHR